MIEELGNEQTKVLRLVIIRDIPHIQNQCGYNLYVKKTFENKAN